MLLAPLDIYQKCGKWEFELETEGGQNANKGRKKWTNSNDDNEDKDKLSDDKRIED